jgi:hypothetical protein
MAAALQTKTRVVEYVQQSYGNELQRYIIVFPSDEWVLMLMKGFGIILQRQAQK